MKKKNIARNKRILSFALVLTLMSSLLPMENIWAKEEAKAQEQEAKEEETQEIEYEKIEIDSVEDLIQLAKNCHVDAWSADKYVTLTQDINVAGSEFKNISVFNGIFDGNGHTISGFQYDGEGYVAGLFRYVGETGTIANLTLKGSVTSEDEKQRIGGICGVNKGVIRNCTFQGSVNGKNETGGIAGINEATGMIHKCTVKGRIIGYYYTGGIAGKNYGVIDNCTNYSNINDSGKWVEEDDEISAELIMDIADNSKDVKLQSGVDTGGIAGFSRGTVTRCTNNGIIGYEHTGYNIGGIVGRQSGVVSQCTNLGTVYGRKDIGGIVGQMEPYIEYQEADSVRKEIDTLHDMIEKTLDDMTEGKDVIKNDVDVLQAYSDNAIGVSEYISDSLSEYMDKNTDQINSLAGRIDHVTELLPGVMNNADAAGNSMSDFNNTLKKLNEDLNVSGKLSGNQYQETDYKRLSLASSIGGTLQADNMNPAEGDSVTITVKADNGYEIKSLTVTDANGKKIAISQTASNQYSFTMPKENILVAAEYTYVGAFIAKSNEGGNITVTNKNDGTIEIEARAYSGYELGNSHTVSIGGSNTVTLIPDGSDSSVYKAIVNKSGYQPSTEPVLVEGSFQKKANAYKITTVSSTGGSIQTESSYAAVGDKVTVRVRTSSYKYSVDSIQAVGNSGSVMLTESSTTPGEYYFTMTAGDKEVQVVFKYTPETDDAIYGVSNVGGNVAATRSTSVGNAYEILLSPSSGYEVDSGISFVATGANGNTKNVNRSDMEAVGDNSYRYVLNGDNMTTPIKITGSFQKKTGSYDISSVGGTGGTVTTQSSQAAAGEKIEVTTVSKSGYRLKELRVSDSNGNPISYQTSNKHYSFVMPDDDVEITAIFEPILLVMQSNVGGSVAYSGKDGDATKVILKVTPDSGYTVSQTPSVTDKNGNAISLAKAEAGSFTYEFYLTKNQEPAKAAITFSKQSQETSAQDAMDRINANAGTLNGQSNNISMQMNQIKVLLQKDDGSIKSYNELTADEKDELEKLIVDLSESITVSGTAAAEILSDLSLIATIYGPYMSDAAKAANKDIAQATNNIQSIIDYLKYAGNGVRGIVDYLNAQEDIQIAKLGGDFDENMDAFREQLQGMSDTIGSISDHASSYSDVINQDLSAINDQINKIFNLFVDKMEDYSSTDKSGFYSDVSEEEIEAATQGRVDDSINKGVVKGDIDVGGIAGSMAIDEEDPEDNAAGSSEKGLGGSYTTKCIIKGSSNYGFVTAKKNGAGGIVGFMNHGIVTDCKAYGSVESTGGDYVGGISGESLTLIRNCYALCTISGNKNVGGIAGYGDTISDCYAMVNLLEAEGRFGAIAGQVATKDEDEKESQESKVSNNFYVGDDIYGVDNISFIGEAEPITYEELLMITGLPNDFWHLKVTYKVDDIYLGTQEIKYGESLEGLNFPEAPKKEGYYCVWPDVSGEIMTGNLVIEGEYKENITVVESSTLATLQADEEKQEKALAYVEGVFTEDARLNAHVSDIIPPTEVVDYHAYTVYDILLENSGKAEIETFALRLLNPFEKTQVWLYQNGEWQQIPCKVRGQYVQVEMTGTSGTFCIVEESSSIWKYVAMVAGVAAGIILLKLLHSVIKKRKKKGTKKKKEKKQKA